MAADEPEEEAPNGEPAALRAGQNGPGGRPPVLSLTIRDKSALFSAYMPFLKNGGLFIPTNKRYEIGDEVFMLLTLMEEQDKLSVAGTVVWVTPAGAQGNRAAGIGIQFKDSDTHQARTRIESLLGGALKSERQTHTM